MSEPQSRLKGDRVVESLERGEHWFTQHRVKIAIFAGAFIVASFALQAVQNQNSKEQAGLWNKASKLLTSEEKITFIAENPKADATSFLLLQTSRQLLEEGKFGEAEKLTSQFISSRASHPRLSSALMVRAYAREEQGNLEGAKADYQKAQGMGEKVDRLFASQALARLP